MKIKLVFISLIFILISIFFKDFIIKGQLPIPSDTIAGLYYPFRDLYAKDYPRGVPYKNFLITDPVRQQYPWKNLVITAEKNLNIPLWNPYNFSGTPLLGNFQSGAFYPVNFPFFLFPFSFSWSLFILIQPFLAGLFLFLYLDNLKLDRKAAFLGAVTFAFCGFSISWMEWGNIISTALWLPLLLLSIDKIVSVVENRKKLVFWGLVYLLSMLFSFSAGHLQIFFYLFVVSSIYFLLNIYKSRKAKKTLPIFLIIYSIFFIVSSFIWIPALQFILLSARNLDQVNWRDVGWFIPWQNLIQFISPDFFGNPATLNYFGVWNYGEFIGYIGIGSLMLAFYAIISKKDKNIFFFAVVLLISIIFAFPNLVSSIPFRLAVPFISTSQPTRLMFLIDFSLSILAALGLDQFIKNQNKKKILPVLFLFASIFGFLWIFVLGGGFGLENASNILVSKRNLIFPSIVFVITFCLFLVYLLFPKNNKHQKNILNIVIGLIIIASVADLFRLGWKYMAFTDNKYLFPQTSALSFLQKNTGNFRIMETDSQILPPNFSIMYKLQSVDGYDPLYIQRYGELMAALGRNTPNIDPPFGFNRIITPHNYDTPLINLLGVKYIVSISDINNPRFNKVFGQGQTQVYENSTVIDRAFFVGRTINAVNKQNEIDLMYENFPLNQRVVISSQNKSFDRTWGVGMANIKSYEANKVEIKTNNEKEGFLVLTDSFYPTWHATIDGKETKIYITDFAFRGIVVPKGEHTIIFYDTLF